MIIHSHPIGGMSLAEVSANGFSKLVEKVTDWIRKKMSTTADSYIYIYIYMDMNPSTDINMAMYPMKKNIDDNHLCHGYITLDF